MYFILLVESKRDNNQSLFRFYCDEVDGVKVLYSTNSVAELKEKLINLLNIYSKEDLFIINKVGWDLLIDVKEVNSDLVNLTTDDAAEIYNNVYEEVFNA